jgi:transglutaminase-like putative cysteine protease
VALDPTNDVPVGQDHVTLAWGRDYGDVAPLRGVIRGSGRAVPQVAVTVEPDEQDELDPPAAGADAATAADTTVDAGTDASNAAGSDVRNDAAVAPADPDLDDEPSDA